MEAVGVLHENTSVLRLLQIWDHNDTSIYSDRTQRFSVNGLSRFWQAVDRTVRYKDIKLQSDDKEEEPTSHRFKIDRRPNLKFALPRPPRRDNNKNK